ncbi:MAG: (Na+)-NQR maturation NqrM [Planctomycetota bacterium]
MQFFLITLGVFLAAAAAMSVGVIVAGKRIKGSCGGLANFKDDQGNSICEACSTPSPDCRGQRLGAREAVGAGAAESAAD